MIKSLKHASLLCRHRLTLTCVEADDLEEETKQKDPPKFFDAWKTLSQANGVIVPGGFGTRGTEGKVAAAKYARERKLPYLGEFQDCVAVQNYHWHVVNLFCRRVSGNADCSDRVCSQCFGLERCQFN